MPLALVAIPAIAFWRSTMNLQGHAKAGAEVIAIKLGQQMSGTADPRDDDLRHDMERVREALPGLGEPVSLRVFAESPSSGRTLAELNLRGVTGATVLAILRHGEQVLVPSGHERLHAGDVLAVAGSEESIAAARELLEPLCHPERQRGIQRATLMAGHEHRIEDPSRLLGMTTWDYRRPMSNVPFVMVTVPVVLGPGASVAVNVPLMRVAVKLVIVTEPLPPLSADE